MSEGEILGYVSFWYGKPSLCVGQVSCHGSYLDSSACMLNSLQALEQLKKAGVYFFLGSLNCMIRFVVHVR